MEISETMDTYRSEDGNQIKVTTRKIYEILKINAINTETSEFIFLLIKTLKKKNLIEL
jgi:hypothetical protein